MTPYPRLSPRAARLPAPLAEGIRFRQVTFRYPHSERLTLSKFDLFIPAGRTVAIVGANGGGKSTLIKLICRLYDPQEGRIELDGIDLRNVPLQEVRSAIAVLFQDPVRYNETVAENIRLGNRAAEPDRSEIERAGEGAGARDVVERLPRGYDTLWGKWFADGTELSGGNGNGFPWPEPFFARPPSSFWMNRPAVWIPGLKPNGWISCPSKPGAKRW